MSTIDLLTSEIKSNSDTIGLYLENESKYLSGMLPSPQVLSDLIDNLKYSDLVTFSNVNSPYSQSLQMGVLSDNIYRAASIIREGTLVYQTKASLYSAEEVSLGYQIEHLNDLYGWEFNVVRGYTPEQRGLLG